MDPSLLLAFLVFASFVTIGFGVPVPEEGIFLIAAYLVATSVRFFPVLIACILGIAVADTLAYTRGRTRAALFVKFKEGRKFIANTGFFAMFSSRFVIATRMVVPFMAGAMRMPRFSFHVASLLGALVASVIALLAGSYVYRVLALATPYVVFFWLVFVLLVTGVFIMYATRAQVKLQAV